jgi:hypothetical protein
MSLWRAKWSSEMLALKSHLSCSQQVPPSVTLVTQDNAPSECLLGPHPVIDSTASALYPTNLFRTSSATPPPVKLAEHMVPLPQVWNPQSTEKQDFHTSLDSNTWRALSWGYLWLLCLLLSINTQKFLRRNVCMLAGCGHMSCSRFYRNIWHMHHIPFLKCEIF